MVSYHLCVNFTIIIFAYAAVLSFLPFRLYYL